MADQHYQRQGHPIQYLTTLALLGESLSILCDLVEVITVCLVALSKLYFKTTFALIIIWTRFIILVNLGKLVQFYRIVKRILVFWLRYLQIFILLWRLGVDTYFPEQ